MGGTDHPDNLVDVSVEEHAELHLDLYLEHGKWEDWIAYRGLAGIIGHEEVVYFVSEQRKQQTSKSNIEYYKSEEGQQRRQIISQHNRNVKSQELKQAWSDGKFDNRTKPTGRPKGVKDTKPRTRQHRQVCYNDVVYSSATELAQLVGETPQSIRRKAKHNLHNFRYV